MNLKRISDIKIEFTISPDLDVEGFFISKNEIKEGNILFDQFEKSFKTVCDDNNTFDSDPEIISEKIREYYKNNLSMIQKKFDDTLFVWNKIKTDFINETSKVFLETRPCHQDIVLIYPSLWNMGIINMKKEAISFPVDAKSIDEMVYVALHELLHVFFYSYINNVYKIDFNKITQKELWDMAEIFNSVVLSQTEFRKFYSQYNFLNYPEHEEKIKVIASTIEKIDIDMFLSAYNSLFLDGRLS